MLGHWRRQWAPRGRRRGSWMYVEGVKGVSPICMRSCRCLYLRGKWGSWETVVVGGERGRKVGGGAGSLAEASWRRRRRQGNCACVPVIGHARGIDVVLTALPRRSPPARHVYLIAESDGNSVRLTDVGHGALHECQSLRMSPGLCNTPRHSSFINYLCL